MTDGTFALSGSGPQTFYLNCYQTGSNQPGNYNTYRITVVYQAHGWGSWTNNTQSWSASTSFGYSWGGNFTIPYPGTSDITLLDTTFNVGADGNGYQGGFTASASISTNHSTIGSGSGSVGLGAPARIPKVPAAPTGVAVDTPTPTTLRYRFSGNDDGGSAILEWSAEASLSSSFTSPIVLSSNGTSTFTGLVPNSTYYFRSRGRNSIGWGAYSGTLSGTTLPATAPAFTVASNPSGTSAHLTLGPANADTYTYWWRVQGTTTANTFTVPGAGASTPKIVDQTGLTPGVTYEWQAKYTIGGYDSPISSWQAVTQSNPSTSTGTYFDGTTLATADLTYSWSGTADASTSRATGRGVTNWFVSAGSSGATAVLSQSSASFVGNSAALVTFTSDSTLAGFAAGISSVVGATADVVGGATYSGSMYVKTSRDQRFVLVIQWLDSARAALTPSTSASVLVTGNLWTRLGVTAAAPVAAQYAYIYVLDTSGTGWAIWKGGDTMLLDAAMLAMTDLTVGYFDGDTADTTANLFSWTGTPHASASIMDVNTTSAADPLADPDCPPPPDPPRPPVIDTGCVVETGIWRRYWANIPATNVPDWQSAIPTVTVRTLGAEARQVRIRYYPNPTGGDPTLLPVDSFCAEQVISYMPASYQMILDGIMERATAQGVIYGSSNSYTLSGTAVAADHLLYGTGGSPATWPELSCGVAYAVSVDVPPTAAPENLQLSIDLATRW